jgi:NAD+ kinase
MKTQDKRRFAIFGNLYQPKKSAGVQKILSCLAAKGAEVLMERDFYDFLVSGQQLRVEGVEVFDGSDFDADFVISMGGDGTFLKAAARVGNKGIPILGVNMGRLGFLADVNPEDIEHTLRALHEGHYEMESRAVIEVNGHYALNDIAILKRDTASMISIRATINDQLLNIYQADGLIISTPTGSTAYSLSNGGPIIVPGTNVLAMTPVASHSLNTRPIVLPDSAVIELDVESRSHNYLIAVDGRSMTCQEGTKLVVRRAPYNINVVKRPGQRYFNTLREKMMWGADAR